MAEFIAAMLGRDFALACLDEFVPLFKRLLNDQSDVAFADKMDAYFRKVLYSKPDEWIALALLTINRTLLQRQADKEELQQLWFDFIDDEELVKETQELIAEGKQSVHFQNVSQEEWQQCHDTVYKAICEKHLPKLKDEYKSCE